MNPLAGTFFKCSESEADGIEIDIDSLSLIKSEHVGLLSPVEHRFLEMLMFECEKGNSFSGWSYTISKSESGDPRSVHDISQAEICELLLGYHGVPIPKP